MHICYYLVTLYLSYLAQKHLMCVFAFEFLTFLQAKLFSEIKSSEKHGTDNLKVHSILFFSVFYDSSTNACNTSHIIVKQ